MPSGVLDESNTFSFDEPTPEVVVSPEDGEAVRLTEDTKWPHAVKYIEGRVDFYKKFHPGGMPVSEMSEAERGKWWAVANEVIGELEKFKNHMEGTASAVKRSQQAIRESRR